MWLLLPAALAGLLLATPSAVAQGQNQGQEQEEPEDPSALPDGEGRDDTFYLCTACHSSAVIRRSGLTHQQWDDLMDWMVEKQGMAPLDPAERKRVVDYLASAFPPRRTRPPAFSNPFPTN